jgi:hypothetical protein
MYDWNQIFFNLFLFLFISIYLFLLPSGENSPQKNPKPNIREREIYEVKN